MRCKDDLVEGACLKHPQHAEQDVLRQYTLCYILIMTGGLLFPDKTNNIVSMRWVPLLEDFNKQAIELLGRSVAASPLCSRGSIRDSRGGLPMDEMTSFSHSRQKSHNKLSRGFLKREFTS
ncbi:hypothetical protein PIB30_040163 [Stylosanthes scabra]|uniref:Uncharacterized protein n=1 Tax=Stylosanthes scabra TaxID=79078 RepID=A0ABU6XFR8_9FABA|nr:hypothetical protein [Stylosanthes scabra]